MIKIGILGSDNSHALGFSKACNFPGADGSYYYEDVRITHLYGHDPEQTRQVAKDGNIEQIVEYPEDMLGQVDAVMIVFRDGIYHSRYAMPFIRAGIPVWVDKPLAITVEDVAKMTEAAKKSGCLLSGGSCCKLVPDIQEVKEHVTDCKKPILSAILNFPVQIDSIYSGMHFYANHLVEMMTEVFGYHVQKVWASVKGKNITAVITFPEFEAVFAFLADSNVYQFTIFHPDEICF